MYFKQKILFIFKRNTRKNKKSQINIRIVYIKAKHIKVQHQTIYCSLSTKFFINQNNFIGKTRINMDTF